MGSKGQRDKAETGWDREGHLWMRVICARLLDRPSNGAVSWRRREIVRCVAAVVVRTHLSASRRAVEGWNQGEGQGEHRWQDGMQWWCARTLTWSISAP